MPDPVIQPALSYNFWILLWEVQGPGLFGVVQPKDAGARFAIGLASMAVSAVSQAFLGAFSEASGLNTNLEVETYQEGGNNTGPLKFPKWAKFDNVTLKRGVTPRTSFWDWHQQIIAGASPVLRKSGIIILFDRGGIPLARGEPGPGQAVSTHDQQNTFGLTRIPLAAWYIDNAFPEKVTGPTLDAKSNTIAIEALELAHDGLQRVSFSMIPGAADAMSSFGGLLGGG
jgi:phage tail-like protein